MKMKGVTLFLVFALLGWLVEGSPPRLPASAETESAVQAIEQIEEVGAELFPLLSPGWSEILKPLKAVEEINPGQFERSLQDDTEAGFLPGSGGIEKNRVN